MHIFIYMFVCTYIICLFDLLQEDLQLLRMRITVRLYAYLFAFYLALRAPSCRRTLLYLRNMSIAIRIHTFSYTFSILNYSQFLLRIPIHQSSLLFSPFFFIHLSTLLIFPSILFFPSPLLPLLLILSNPCTLYDSCRTSRRARGGA